MSKSDSWNLEHTLIEECISISILKFHSSNWRMSFIPHFHSSNSFLEPKSIPQNRIMVMTIFTRSIFARTHTHNSFLFLHMHIAYGYCAVTHTLTRVYYTGIACPLSVCNAYTQVSVECVLFTVKFFDISIYVLTNTTIQMIFDSD